MSILWCPKLIKYREIVSVDVTWIAVLAACPESSVQPAPKGISIYWTCPDVTVNVLFQVVVGLVIVTEQVRGADTRACKETVYCGAEY